MELNYYEAVNLNSRQALIFAGGSGDGKDTFGELVELLRTEIPDYSTCTFSYSPESEGVHPIAQQTEDIEKVCEYLVAEKGIETISVFGTSLGAYCAVYLMMSPKYGKILRDVVFCDPADNYQVGEAEFRQKSWNGSEAYKPSYKVVSDLLKDVMSEVAAHVIHFTLKNYGSGRYIERECANRGKDHSDAFVRLNTKMVKSFYSKLPKKNRGKYIEDENLPHGFMRDGDVEKNQKRIVELIVELLGN